MDYYKILNIRENTTVDEIKKSYRKKTLEYYKNNNKNTEILNEAYNYLIDNHDKIITFNLDTDNIDNIDKIKNIDISEKIYRENSERINQEIPQDIIINKNITLRESYSAYMIPINIERSKIVNNINYTDSRYFGKLLSDLHRAVNHFSDIELPRVRTNVRTYANFDEHTVEYILGKKTKEQLATTIMKNDIQRKKYLDLLNVYELLSVVGIEKFAAIYQYYIDNHPLINKKVSTTNLTQHINIVVLIVESIIEFNNLIEHCNKQIVNVSATYNKSIVMIQKKECDRKDLNRRNNEVYSIVRRKFTKSEVTSLEKKYIISTGAGSSSSGAGSSSSGAGSSSSGAGSSTDAGSSSSGASCSYM